MSRQLLICFRKVRKLLLTSDPPQRIRDFVSPFDYTTSGIESRASRSKSILHGEDTISTMSGDGHDVQTHFPLGYVTNQAESCFLMKYDLAYIHNDNLTCLIAEF